MSTRRYVEVNLTDVYDADAYGVLARNKNRKVYIPRDADLVHARLLPLTASFSSGDQIAAIVEDAKDERCPCSIVALSIANFTDFIMAEGIVQRSGIGKGGSFLVRLENDQLAFLPRSVLDSYRYKEQKRDPTSAYLKLPLEVDDRVHIAIMNQPLTANYHIAAYSVIRMDSWTKANHNATFSSDCSKGSSYSSELDNSQSGTSMSTNSQTSELSQKSRETQTDVLTIEQKIAHAVMNEDEGFDLMLRKFPHLLKEWSRANALNLGPN